MKLNGKPVGIWFMCVSKLSVLVKFVSSVEFKLISTARVTLVVLLLVIVIDCTSKFIPLVWLWLVKADVGIAFKYRATVLVTVK